MAKLKKKINGAWQTVSGTWPVHFSSDIPPATTASGTITLAADVTTSQNVQITTIADIGFVPDFFLLRSPSIASGYTYETVAWSGENKSVVGGADGEAAIKTSTAAWTTQTNGYLYYNASTGVIYYRAYNSTYGKMKAGTWSWVAVKLA